MSAIRVGDAEIRRVEEMPISSPMAVLTQDQALLEANRHWLMPRFLKPDGHWDFIFQSWILLVDGKVVVVDPCTGNGRPHPMPLFNMLDTPFIERFAATGIRPEDVDCVFCTHLHHDHCGWNTRLRDGRFVPTFPNARYLFVRREYERWDTRRPDHRVVDYNVGVFERSVLPVMEAGLALLVNDTHRISASVAIEPAYGHTAGHSILHLVSKAREAYFTGDVFHHPLQMLDARLHMPGCDNLEQAIATRRRVAGLCAARNALVVPAHFPTPHAGWVRPKDGAFTFEALASAGGQA
jgi:glyoxylase-like metal-dependent hydrolase (beta-lactamase superfamily II)